MVYSRFGLSKIHQRTEIDEILKSAKKVDSISAQILLREAYEISYEIFDHNQDYTHPWALVQTREKENYFDYGTLHRTIYSYRLREINKRFDLSITEFLDLPREIVELLIKVSDEELARDSKSYNEIKDQLDQDFGK